jgi:cellulose synthase (UDP-forming)/endoglucanase
MVSADGALSPLPEGHMLGRTFSFDSIRIAWRLELACQLMRDRRACDLSATLARHVEAVVARDGRFVTSYDAGGTPLTTRTSLSFPAAFLPAMTRVVPDRARSWRARELGDEALDQLMRVDDRYYDANWAWFGLAAADGVLVRRTPSLDRLRVPVP